MKRKALSLILIAALATTMYAQVVSSEDVCSLPQAVKDTVTSLRLTGQLTTTENSDYRQLREVCGRLANLDLSAADVTSIPENALFAASQLKSLILPAKLKHIGRYAFFRCIALQGNLTLPEGVETVGEGAFQGCRKVQHLNLPSTLREIGPWAFSYLSEIRDSVIIPEGVRKIGRGAFYMSFRIRGIELPSTVDTISADAFNRCVLLRDIRMNATRPPVLHPAAFRDDVYKNATLTVPEGCEEAYKNAPVWNRFFGTWDAEEDKLGNKLSLIPMPEKVEMLSGEGLSWNRLPLLAGAGMYTNEYEQLTDVLEANSTYEKPKGAQMYMPVLSIDKSLDPEGYVLEIQNGKLDIKGGSEAGIFYGIMTLRQVLLSYTNGGAVCSYVPALRITDKPRIKVRELMIDPARTFIKSSEIEEFIKEMAYLKYNTLQLHLCDDQAWRVEIKAYPELTAQSSTRPALDDMHRESKGFYTQSELRYLVDFASKWHVTLVPEIEMPGHQTAAMHALPWLACDSTRRLPIRVRSGVANELLCPGRESTYEFLNTVIDELVKIFPGKYFHLGGDEAGNPPLGYWTKCPDCQALAKKLGVKADGTENWKLQEYMFSRIIGTLRDKHGKTPMFWYETDFHNIPQGCVTYAWRHGKTKLAIEAAQRNNAHIMMCPGEYCYFDYPMVKGDLPDKNWGMHPTPLEKVYAFDPTWGMGETFEKNTLFGAAGTLWGECTPETERVRYMAFPRAFALSEVLWSPQSARDYNKFLQRLEVLTRDLSRRAVPWSNKF